MKRTFKATFVLRPESSTLSDRKRERVVIIKSLFKFFARRKAMAMLSDCKEWMLKGVE